MQYDENDFLYTEGDEATSIFFTIKGEAAYVLDEHDNYEYISIQHGDEFGFADIAFDTIYKMLYKKKGSKSGKKDEIYRQFSVRAKAAEDLEVYCFTLQSIN